MAYSTKVNRELCTSVASCVAIAPETYELDEEGIAVVKKQGGDPDEVILEAAKSCPVNAILVYDEDGKKLWPQD